MTKILRCALLCRMMGQWKDEARLTQPGSEARTWAKKLGFHLEGEKESQKILSRGITLGRGVY